MGASGKWIKSLISLKKPIPNDQDKGKKKWRLWRSSSEGAVSSSVKKRNGVVSDKSESSSFLLDDAFTAAMAAVVRAPPKGFMVIKQEWAAIRIQALFRGFLARRALRALRAVVRLQAIFRGRQVRKQAAVTLRCMQALVRVQERVKARSVSMSPERKRPQTPNPLNQAEQGWCDIPGTVDEVKAKLQKRQEAAIRRERAMAYSLSSQQSRVSGSPNSRFSKPMSPRSVDSRSLLERWMAAKPWESRLKDERYFDTPDMTPMSTRNENLILPKATRNPMTTRVSPKPPITSQSTPSSMSSSSSAISSECMYDDSPLSPSSTSPEKKRNIHKPSFMSFTESTRAKQKTCRCSSVNGDARSSSGSDPSVNFWKDVYGTPQRGRYQRRCSSRR